MQADALEEKGRLAGRLSAQRLYVDATARVALESGASMSSASVTNDVTESKPTSSSQIGSAA